MIKPGDKLSNGAEVIMVLSCIGGITLVMCHWDGNTMPWVTWRLDEDGNVYWGRYFASSESAAENFNHRVKHVIEVTGIYGT